MYNENFDLSHFQKEFDLNVFFSKSFCAVAATVHEQIGRGSNFVYTRPAVRDSGMCTHLVIASQRAH